jgi:hypothetical protein
MTLLHGVSWLIGGRLGYVRLGYCQLLEDFAAWS